MKNKSILNKIIENSEEIAFYILSGWCLLPIVMTFVDVYNYLAGNFPSEEELAKAGQKLGGVVYTLSLSIYRKLFTLLGIITIVFVLFCLINKSKTIFTKKSFKDKPWFFFLMALLVWAFISTILADDVTMSFMGSDYDFNGYFSFLVYVSIFITGSIVSSKALRKKLVLLFTLVITVLSIIMFVQCFNIHFLDCCFPAGHSVVFNNSNHFAYLLCMADIAYVSLYLFDEKKFNYLYLIGFIFILYVLLINNTFGAYIGLFFGFIFTYVLYKIRNNKLNIKSLLPLITFIFVSLLSAFGLLPLCENGVLSNFITMFTDIKKLATKQDDYLKGGSSRIILWKETLEIIGIRPLFGIGGDCIINEYALSGDMTPHNEYLTYACYFGIPALLFYLSSLITLAINRFKKINTLDTYIVVVAPILFTYLVSAFFGNIVFNTAPYYWMVLGICGGVNENETPLFLPVTKEKQIRKAEPRKLVSILVVIISLAVLSYLWLNWSNEKNSERADLCAMKAAYSMANYCYQKGDLQLGEYWYNDSGFSFIPLEENKPLAYGYGTDYNVKYTNTFNKANKTDFEYDGSLDYTNKVIKVTLSLNNDKTLNISLVWE